MGSAIVELNIISISFVLFFIFVHSPVLNGNNHICEKSKNRDLRRETSKIRHAYFGNVEPVRRGLRAKR